MIDGFFPSCSNLKLEETKLALTRYAAVIPYLSFSPELVHGIQAFSDRSASWYVTKYNEMSWFTRLSYDKKEEVEALNKKIKDTVAGTVLKPFKAQFFLDEFNAMKQLPPRTNLLEAIYNVVTHFKLEDWIKFLKTTFNTQKAYESIAAFYYECSLNNRQIGGFDVFENLKLAFQIPNDFIRTIAIRITFIYKENSEHSFSESQLGVELGKLNCYVLANGKEPITLLEQLIEEKNEPVLSAILKELNVASVDGLIHACIHKKQARNAEFLLRFPHTLNDETVRAMIAQIPAPQRKNTTVYTDESDLGFYFVERRLT